jgi:AcrR family transcriptional regulator
MLTSPCDTIKALAIRQVSAIVRTDPRAAAAGSRRGRPPAPPRRGGPPGALRRGRPPGTSRRKLELIALRLFTEQGFDQTPIEQIAAEAGVSRRTFFRYFSSKSSVLWGEFDAEVEAIRAALAAVPATVPMMDAIRRAVVAANHYRAEDVPELRARMNLIISVPALQASAAVRYDAWERPAPSTRSPSARPPWPSAAPPTTAGAPGRTPTSPCTSTPPSPRSPRDSRRHPSAPRNKR